MTTITVKDNWQFFGNRLLGPQLRSRNFRNLHIYAMADM